MSRVREKNLSIEYDTRDLRTGKSVIGYISGWGADVVSWLRFSNRYLSHKVTGERSIANRRIKGGRSSIRTSVRKNDTRGYTMPFPILLAQRRWKKTRGHELMENFDGIMPRMGPSVLAHGFWEHMFVRIRPPVRTRPYLILRVDPDYAVQTSRFQLQLEHNFASPASSQVGVKVGLKFRSTCVKATPQSVTRSWGHQAEP